MPRSPKPPRELLGSIRLLVLDVDGTMTDGRLYYGREGEALKAFDVRDGHGLRLLRIYGGVKLAALTGRRADLVLQRCSELSIDPVVGSSRDKATALRKICDDVGIPLSATAFMGDDVNDLPALRLAALSCAPSDAAREVLREVRWVSQRRAGRGAVRELCEVLLAATVGWPPDEETPRQD
ncbi:MAG TPA: HAD-IIIA family hydrolase [Myxococcales bacterium]|jgi:3-deoxy-D-manno-octulosonate 8-phosphate phosphatase (KDO 8-P phosphatase)|nr:HAD-IIIA family hydrolase [Myxococcales bacterium]